MKFQNPITLLFKQNNGKSQICLERPDYRNGWLCGLRLCSAYQRNRLPCQTDDIGTIWGCQCGHFLSWWTNWPSTFLKSWIPPKWCFCVSHVHRRSWLRLSTIRSTEIETVLSLDDHKSIISEFCKSIHALMYIYASNMRRSDPSWKYIENWWKCCIINTPKKRLTRKRSCGLNLHVEMVFASMMTVTLS